MYSLIYFQTPDFKCTQEIFISFFDDFYLGSTNSDAWQRCFSYLTIPGFGKSCRVDIALLIHVVGCLLQFSQLKGYTQ